MTQNGQPFYKGPLPPFIDQGGEGVLQCGINIPHTLLCTFPTNMCMRCTSPIHPFLLSLLIAGNLHDIRPHETCTSTGICEEREKNGRDSVYGFLPGPPRTRHPVFAPVTASGPTSRSVRACLSVGLVRPPSSVARSDSSNCMLIVWSFERPHACLSLHPLRTFTRRYASVSDSSVGLLLLIPFTCRHRPSL